MGCYAVAEYRLWPGGAEPFRATARDVSEALGLAPGRGALRVAIGDQDDTHALWVVRWDDPDGQAAAHARLPAELRARLAVSIAAGMNAPWRWYAPIRTIERAFVPAAFCSVVRLRVAPEDGGRLVESWLDPVLERVAAQPELASSVALRAVDDPGAFMALQEWRRPIGPELSRELLRVTPPPVPLLAWDRSVGWIGQTRDRYAVVERMALVGA